MRITLTSFIAFFCFFSVFLKAQTTIVLWNFEDGNNTVDGGLPTNNSSSISSSATGAISFFVGGGSVNCTNYISHAGWTSGAGTKYWELSSFSTLGYAGLSIGFQSRGSNTGPRDFKLQYSLTGSSFTDVGSASYSISATTNCTFFSFSLPTACDNKSIIYLRFLQTSNTSVDGSSVQSGGTNGLDNISISASNLPINLLFFEPQINNSYVNLLWSTATEKNNDYVAIERSVNGQNFSEIGRVPGAGNSVERIDYSFIDHFPYPGTNYYRLRQVDFDGTSTAYKVVAVEFNGESANALDVTQNPAEVSIQFHAPNAPGQLLLVDAMGRIIRSQKFEENVSSARISTQDLPRGYYVLQIRQTDGLIKARPLIK